jgi:hypothetical protein
MDHHREGQTSTARRSLKRKLEREFEDQSEHRKVLVVEPRKAPRDLAGDVLAYISVLDSTSFSAAEADRASAKSAADSLSELAKYGTFSSLLKHQVYMFVYVCNQQMKGGSKS